MASKRLQCKTCSLVVVSLLLHLTVAAPEYRYGEIGVLFDEKGIVTLSYLLFNLQGQILTWGYPGWQWDTACSLQSEWIAESADDVIAGYANCSYGYFLWWIKPWPASDCLVLEVTIEAQTDILFDDIAWVLYLPVEQFAGYSAVAIRSDGTAQAITFRVEYVPGQAGLGPGASGAGWIVPFGEGVGVVTTIFSDVSPGGPYLDVTDDRGDGGTTYSVRQILFPGMNHLPLNAGSSFTFYVYLHPFNSVEEREVAQQRLLNIISLLDQGVRASEIRDRIAAGGFEEFVEQLRAQRLRQRVIYAAVAVSIILIAMIAALKLRRRAVA